MFSASFGFRGLGFRDFCWVWDGSGLRAFGLSGSRESGFPGISRRVYGLEGSPRIFCI